MRELLSKPVQGGQHRAGIEMAPIVADETGPGTLLRDHLVTVVAESTSQELVSSHQTVHRLLQTLRFHRLAVELGIEVAAHTAENLLIPAADPVGMLYGGQGERCRLVDYGARARAAGSRSQLRR